MSSELPRQRFHFSLAQMTVCLASAVSDLVQVLPFHLTFVIATVAMLQLGKCVAIYKARVILQNCARRFQMV